MLKILLLMLITNEVIHSFLIHLDFDGMSLLLLTCEFLLIEVDLMC